MLRSLRSYSPSVFPVRRCGRNQGRQIVLVLALLLAPSVAFAAGGGALEIFPDSRLLIQLVVFAILIGPINKFLFAPIMRVLEERNQQIEGARERAQAVSQEADSVLAAYRETLRSERERVEVVRRERLDGARDERTEASAAARSRAEERVSTARAEIARTLDEARGSLRDEANALAREAASRILGRELQ